MKLFKENIQLSSAHLLSFHKGKCSNVHGHNWLVGVELELVEGSLKDGMIVDFGDIKKIFEKYDHTTLISRNIIGLSLQDKGKQVEFSIQREKYSFPSSKVVLLDEEPTAENLVCIFIDEIGMLLRELYRDSKSQTTIKIKVRVEETPGNVVEHTEDLVLS